MKNENVPVIATWFHADSNSYRGTYSQTLGDSTSLKHFEIYLRSIFVFFASIIRQNEKVKLKLFLNDVAFDILKNEFKKQLIEWKVELVVLRNTHKFYDQANTMWANQFFILDIIRFQSSLNEDFCLMDSDVICINKQVPKLKLIEDVILYKLSNSPEEMFNGLSVSSLSSLGKTFGYEDTSREMSYYGGELIYVSKFSIKMFSRVLEDIYRKNRTNFEGKVVFATEEAHLISIASTQFRTLDAGDNLIIKRIWTQPWTFRQIPKDWRYLTYLHLPAEKKTGLFLIYEAVINKNSWFWKAESSQWNRRISRLLGLQSYGFKKLIIDIYMLRKGLLRHLKLRLSKCTRITKSTER